MNVVNISALALFSNLLMSLFFILAILFIAIAAAIVVLTIGCIRIWIKEERRMKLNGNE